MEQHVIIILFGLLLFISCCISAANRRYDARRSEIRDIVNKTNTSINDRRNKTDRNKQVQKDTMNKKNQNSGCNNYLYSSSTSYDNNYYVGQSHNHDDSTSSSHNYGGGSSGGGGCSDSWSDSSSSCDCSSSD